jgi:hypothetical protein
MRQEKRQQPNAIYVFSCGEFCKIGITKNVLGRLKSLECVNPFDIQVALYAVVDQVRKIEKSAHDRLAHKRHRNEWFKCGAEEAIQTINAIADDLGVILAHKEVEACPHGDGMGFSRAETSQRYR